MAEVVQVALAQGVPLPADYADERLAFTDTVPASMTSSMHHDLEQGNRLEVAWLSGDVVERGARLGVTTPCNRAIFDILSVHSDGRVTSGVSEALTIRSVDAVLVVVPMRRALGTSAMGIAEAPLVLIDLHTDEGITGHAYLFCYLESAGHAVVALARDVSAVLAGTEVSPAAVRRELGARFKLLGARGLVSAVLAGVDVACWDALAIAAGLPLARMLGAPMRPTTAYNSNGLGLLEPRAAADEAQELVAEGFRAIKMRLGRPSGDDDLAAVRAVRAAIGPDVVLMSDYNQALSANAARERCRQLDDEGLDWIEEPVRHDDYATSAELAALLRTPVQIGENFTGPRAMSAALAEQCQRSRDAGRRPYRRRQRLAGRCRAGGRSRNRDVVPPVPRSQRSPSRRHANGPLDRIRGLGRPHPPAAAACG